MVITRYFRTTLQVVLTSLGGLLWASAAVAQSPGEALREVFKELDWKSVSEPEKSRLDPEQMGQWLSELGSGDGVARELAVQSMIEWGWQIVPHLRTFLEGQLSTEEMLAAQRAFSAVTGVTPATAEKVDGHLSQLRSDKFADTQKAAVGILDLGNGAVDYALRQVNDTKVQRWKALARRLSALHAVSNMAVGDNYEDSASEVLAEMGDAVVAELTSIAMDPGLETEWRAMATERLLFFGGARVQSQALHLAGDKESAVRRLAVSHLCYTAGANDFEKLAVAVAPVLHRDRTVYAALTEFGERVSTKRLSSSLDRERLPVEVRAFAATLLGQRRDAEARDILLENLEDDAPLVVAEALVALGKIGEQEDLDQLIDHLGADQPSVRRSAVTAIAALGGDLATAWLSTALKDHDPSVRVGAARLLGRSGDEKAIDALVATLNDSDPNVFAAATASLNLLSGESKRLAMSVSSDQQRRSLRLTWQSWLRRHYDEAVDESSDKEKSEEATAAELDPAAPLATDGQRIFDDLRSMLQSQFRPYGEIKEKEVTETAALCAAALEGMQEVLDRKADPEEPDRLTLELGDGERSVLRHLLKHGEFDDPADLAQRVGSLPIQMSAQDYILLVYGGAQSMVSSLGDRFTRLSFLEDASGKVDKDSLPSLFGKGKSAGMLVEKEASGVEVEFVMALSAADQLGLRRGDKIISINGDLASSLEERKINKLLQEPAKLSVLRDGWTRPVIFDIEPTESDPNDLVRSAMLPGKIGYVRLSGFELGCAQQLEWAIRDLEKQGIEGLVFDLRNNPGGTVLDAIAIVDKFVAKGETITTTWVNNPDEDEAEDYSEEIHESTDSDTDREYPLAVLVNECSASASEMTSGALQDLERSVTVGRTTWGKGIGQSGGGVSGFRRQSVFGETRTSLSLGITVLEYFLPSGRSIQGIGVQPDVPVARPTLLGERYELTRRVENSPHTKEFVKALVENDAELALQLSRFDAWDEEAYPDFDELRKKLRMELSVNLTRSGIRSALRAHLAAEHPELLIVDVQEDEDVRAAIAALAEPMGLDLATIEEYEDLAD